jgi:endonuclease/exonuclease/phosphatase family metal-dependent hydrolase
MDERRSGRGKLRLVLAASVLALAAVGGWYVAGRLLSPLRAVGILSPARPPAPPAGAGAQSLLRIITYNVAHGGCPTGHANSETSPRAETLRQIGRMLAAEGPDLVVLNEVSFDSVLAGPGNQAERIAREGGFPFRAEQRNIDVSLPFAAVRHGNVLLSLYPIRAARLVDLPGYSAWETVLAGKKRGLLCDVELPGGRAVAVLAVHLEHRSEAVRVASAQAVEELRRTLPLPLVVAGDLNSTLPGFPGARPDGSGRTALSVFLSRDACVTLPSTGCRPEDFTFPAGRPTKVIDWVLLPAAWRVRSKRVLDWPLSDHRPVLVDAELPPG